jgi:chaperonin cofactor prefoldin
MLQNVISTLNYRKDISEEKVLLEQRIEELESIKSKLQNDLVRMQSYITKSFKSCKIERSNISK